MFYCKFSLCQHVTKTVSQFVQHSKLHSNAPNYRYQCGVSECSRMYRRADVLKAHMYRYHKGIGLSLQPSKKLDIPLKCMTLSCTFTCDTLSTLMKHLKSHIKEGLETKCPVRGCDCSFTVASSLASHVSRKHKELGHTLLDLSKPDEPCTMSSQPYLDTVVVNNDEPEEPFAVDETLFLESLALLYLKLQGKLLLPASTIQTVIEDFQNAHEISLLHSLKILSEKLKDLGIPEPTINNIIDEINSGDLLKLYNRNVLSTDQKRKSVFKNTFNYVEPVPLLLGSDENDKECFAQYIPIHDTLATLFKSESFREQHAATQACLVTKNVIQDVGHGHGFQSNQLLKTEPSSIGLILYQDAFEVVNPLGSGKKKHKILAVYLTLTNILPHNRSTTDHMQLVLLCKEKDFKYFGMNKVFEPLIRDLKLLEDRGIVTNDGRIVKGALVAISGDNLGSHCIGGFVENFSRASHFCRYCEIDKNAFKNEPHMCGTTRSPQTYQSHLQALDTNGTDSVCGIKLDSPFNELAYFHVCQPGLPPCLGHDLFEGIVSYDLALFVGHLVQEKHFTYLQLNRCKNQLKYQGNDASCKPADVHPGSERLSGHAAQNWCFLRLLPVFVGDRIKDPTENEVWQLILCLREIVELVCAPAITEEQVSYLKVLIEEYVFIRKRLFPASPLKPKHHYLCHYPELILHFGPLIRLWTLRFESKHAFFKQCARKLHNLKNLCKTLAERHQLLQAYLSAGNFFLPAVNVEKGTEFYVNDYNDRIRSSVVSKNIQSQSALACNEVTVKCTVYRKGMFVVLGSSGGELSVGKIELIVANNESVQFVTEKHTFVKLRDIGVYCVLGSAQDDYVCINQGDLLDYYPLPCYQVVGLPVIALHHSFPEAV